MRLTSFEALNAFAKQLERNVSGSGFKTKVIVLPSALSEKGVAITVAVLKTFIDGRVPASRATRTLRLRVSVCGTAESMTGLNQALCAIEALDRFFAADGLRLEDASGKGIPNSRILQAVSQEDSFFDSPGSTAVQEVQDGRIAVITIPTGE